MATLGFAADPPAQPNMFTTPPATLSGMNWNGFYVGVNGGYGWANSITATINDPIKRKDYTRTSTNPGGFVGGGQFGYNWQSGYWVFGFEAGQREPRRELHGGDGEVRRAEGPRVDRPHIAGVGSVGVSACVPDAVCGDDSRWTLPVRTRRLIDARHSANSG